MKNKATSLVYKTQHNVYYFQYRIPQVIRKKCDVNQQFLRKSLKTKDIKAAIRYSKHIFVAIDSLFESHNDAIFDQHREAVTPVHRVASTVYHDAKRLLESIQFSHSNIYFLPTLKPANIESEQHLPTKSLIQIEHKVDTASMSQLIDKYINY